MNKKIEATMTRKVKVVKPNPEQKYVELKYLHVDSPISDRELLYFIKNGYLKTVIELPLCLVERSTFENYELLEGFVGVRPKDACIILNQGSTELQKFLSIDHSEDIRLANELPQYSPIITVDIIDLLVLEEHEKEFFNKFPEKEFFSEHDV